MLIIFFKILNAQNANYDAVIVCNNDSEFLMTMESDNGKILSACAAPISKALANTTVHFFDSGVQCHMLAGSS